MLIFFFSVLNQKIYFVNVITFHLLVSFNNNTYNILYCIIVVVIDMLCQLLSAGVYLF